MNKDELKKGRVRARVSVDGLLPPRAVGAATPRHARVASQRAPENSEPQPVSQVEAKYYPLPRYEAPARPLKPVRKRWSRKRLALQTVSLVFAVFLSTGGLLAWRGYSNFHKMFHGTTTVAALTEKKVAPYQLNGEGDGRVNILLLGVGGPGHDGPDLTDTMVVLSVDPVNNTATMFSIPRDLWVKMPVNYFGSSQKINAAYESGKYSYLGHMDASSANAAAVQAGFKATDQVVKDVLDLNINYHMLVNFQAFKQAVDTVGGVTVNVPTPLVDPTMAWSNGGNPVLAAAGVQQMNGTKALQYARSRETTSDFARAQRQRQILVALKDKVLTAGTLSNPAKIDGLMNAFGDNVYSDLSTQGALRLVSIMKHIGDGKISSASLVDDNHQLVTTDHVGNISIVRPIAGLTNYTDIQTYVRSKLPDGYIVKERAPITVLSPTAAGASTTAAMLASYGYDVAGSSMAANPTGQPIIVDLSHGSAPYTLHYLEQRFDVKAVTQLPTGVTVSGSATKFVILGTK